MVLVVVTNSEEESPEVVESGKFGRGNWARKVIVSDQFCGCGVVSNEGAFVAVGEDDVEAFNHYVRAEIQRILPPRDTDLAAARPEDAFVVKVKVVLSAGVDGTGLFGDGLQGLVK